MLTVV
jgi:hypothetical protein